MSVHDVKKRAATHLEHKHGHGSGDAWHDVQGIVDGQIGKPGQTSGLQAGDGEAGHALEEAKHAVGEREHGETDEGSPHGDAGGLLQTQHLGPGEQQGLLVLGAISGLLHVGFGLGKGGIRLEPRQLGLLPGAAQGREEHDGAEEEGDDGDGAPPGQAGVDVDMLQQPFAAGRGTPAEVETEFFEEADALGDVEEGLRVELAEEVVGQGVELGLVRGRGRESGVGRGLGRRRHDGLCWWRRRRRWRRRPLRGRLSGRGILRLRQERPEREIPGGSSALGEDAGRCYSSSDGRRGGRAPTISRRAGQG